MTSEKRLVRSKTNKMIGGVCGGLGEYFDFDPTLIRLIFAALIVFGAGSPILLYLLMWIIIPAADSTRAMIGMNEFSSEDTAPDASQSVREAEMTSVEEADSDYASAEQPEETVIPTM